MLQPLFLKIHPESLVLTFLNCRHYGFVSDRNERCLRQTSGNCGPRQHWPAPPLSQDLWQAQGFSHWGTQTYQVQVPRPSKDLSEQEVGLQQVGSRCLRGYEGRRTSQTWRRQCPVHAWARTPRQVVQDPGRTRRNLNIVSFMKDLRIKTTNS